MMPEMGSTPKTVDDLQNDTSWLVREGTKPHPVTDVVCITTQNGLDVLRENGRLSRRPSREE